MGGFLDKPIVEKETSVGQGKVGPHMLKHGLSSMQGWRVEMEDAHVCQFDLGSNPGQCALFCVFDGHAGKTAALHAAEHIPRILVLEESFERGVRGDPIDALGEALAESFFDIDEDLLTQTRFQPGGGDTSGCTALAVAVTETHIVFCNAGDSRAIFVGNKGNVMFSTLDHKPDDLIELERITNAGAEVLNHRVNGDLAVSRALGDFTYKRVAGVAAADQPVTCKPDITILPRRDETDEFVLLACDGIWDVMSSSDVAKYVLEKMETGYGMGRICELLLDHCLELGSRDNMSVIIVALPNAPKQIGTFRGPPPTPVPPPERGPVPPITTPEGEGGGGEILDPPSPEE